MMMAWQRTPIFFLRHQKENGRARSKEKMSAHSLRFERKLCLKRGSSASVPPSEELSYRRALYFGNRTTPCPRLELRRKFRGGPGYPVLLFPLALAWR